MQPFLNARTIDNWFSLRDVEIRDDFCKARVGMGTGIATCSWRVGVSHRDLHASRARCGHRKALHSHNHIAYRSLHRLKTVFHNMFVLKRCMSTHDDMQGANKVRTRCAVSKRIGSTGWSVNAHTHTHNEIDKTIMNAHFDDLLKSDDDTLVTPRWETTKMTTPQITILALRGSN
jgi:hypothetical protein